MCCRCSNKLCAVLCCVCVVCVSILFSIHRDRMILNIFVVDSPRTNSVHTSKSLSSPSFSLTLFVLCVVVNVGETLTVILFKSDFVLCVCVCLYQVFPS